MNRLFLLALLPWLTSAVVNARATPETNAAPPDAFVLRRFEWIPPFTPPRAIVAKFPRQDPIAAVEALTVAEGQLWAVIHPYSQTNLAAGTGRLWSYGDATGLIEPVRGPLAAHVVNTLFAQPGSLWLALDGGMAALDLARFAIHPYGPAQGIVSTNIVGLGAVDGIVVALGRFGALWGLPAGGSNFIRASAAAPPDNPRAPEPWRFFATSGDWMAAGSATSVALRHFRAQQWLPMRAELANGSPRLTPLRLVCAEGDGEGGFWVGSDAGLHWVNPESNVVENRFATLTVTVPGGLGMSFAPGFRPTAAAYEMARDRVMAGIRERMRDRVRYARANTELEHPVNPLSPTSRLPGGVTALHRDGHFLWVATSDGLNTNRGRVLLMHQPTRRWVGWFPVAAPVACLATDDQRLWLGLDASRSAGVSPLVVMDKLPLVAIPQSKWTRDGILAEELGARLASLPVHERAVLAFFTGDPRKVVELLAPDGDAPSGADAETLFLLTFAHDAVGLNQPDRFDHFVQRLRAEHPNSVFAELAGAVRSARATATASEIVRPESAAAVVADPPTPTEIPPAAPTTPPAADDGTAVNPAIAVVLAKQDLSKDGTLNPVEFRLWRGPGADFTAADTNHDGKLDAEEIARLLKQDAVSAPTR